MHGSNGCCLLQALWEHICHGNIFTAFKHLLNYFSKEGYDSEMIPLVLLDEAICEKSSKNLTSENAQKNETDSVTIHQGAFSLTGNPKKKKTKTKNKSPLHPFSFGHRTCYNVKLKNKTKLKFPPREGVHKKC